MIAEKRHRTDWRYKAISWRIIAIVGIALDVILIIMLYNGIHIGGLK